MLVSRFVKLAFAAATLLGQHISANPRCKPSVRREWRSLTPGERAEWIDAVKVKHVQLVVVLTELTLPRTVPQQAASQLFFGADLQHFLLRDPTCQHKRLVF